MAEPWWGAKACGSPTSCTFFSLCALWVVHRDSQNPELEVVLQFSTTDGENGALPQAVALPKVTMQGRVGADQTISGDPSTEPWGIQDRARPSSL